LTRFISIALILIFSIPLMLKTELIVSWKLNQKSIIERFCVNKDKPKLHCDGKCHLGKQLSKVDEPNTDSKTVPHEKLVRVEPSPFIQNCNTTSLFGFKMAKQKLKTNFKANLYAYSFTRLILNPPQLLK